MKILIAEDDPVLNHLLDRHCRTRGYETTVAFDARQTWAHVVKGQPDLVLLDIKMPGGSGIAILKRIHQSSKTSSIPVVVITCVDDPLVLRMVKEQRPDAILSKPLDMATLDEELERLLKDRQSEPGRMESSR